MASSDLDDLFGENSDLQHNPAESTQVDDALSAADDLEIQKILSADPAAGGLTLNFDSDRPIDQSGKADNAVDYEDVSDDDLPDEEPTTATSGDGPGLTDDGGTPNDTDDLFGEDDDNPAYDIFDRPEKAVQNGIGSESFDTALTLPSPPFHDVNFDPPPEQSGIALTQEEKIAAAKATCPEFKVGTVPNLNEWFRPQKAYFRPRTAPKPPKPLTHPKISLDIAQDQERAFRSAGTAFTSDRAQRLEEAAARGIILDLEPEEEVVEIDHFDYTPLDEDEVIAPGITVARLRLALTDFSCLDEHKPPAAEPEITEDDEWMAEFGGQVHKKPKLSDFPLIDQPVYPVPSFHNFEELTAQIGSRVVLDLNDPEILIAAPVEEPKPSKKRLLNGKLKHGANAKNPLSRFNFSNDHAYEALKANNQSKARASIGSVLVEHSMPALKCSWPYYKVRRTVEELRGFHRMPLKFGTFMNKQINFAKSSIRKKKHMKGLSAQQIYAKTPDLSLSDNSTAMLLEYSEEIPTVLSQFGMGNRIINYYRKTHDEDAPRPPKPEVGEIQILQPADESPFNRFGKVDPGQTVPTLHNSMYRAAVFKHVPKKNDFLVIRSTTGVDGTNWHLRNIDHLYVVGQELPFVEVPGPHSRKATNSFRNRMVMLTMRSIKHSPKGEVKISDITKHIHDSTDTQNRQKMKEFAKYDKEAKVWRLKDDHESNTNPVPPLPLSEDGIRAMIKPEDVCLIDAMQVGQRHLADAGYGQADADDEDKATDTQEQRGAPWKVTKNFIEAQLGKAMLELKGHGDPSGIGIAYSPFKTSMKGGFIKNLLGGPMSTSTDAMERQRKANGGHDYNVHEQEAMYSEVLDEIWQEQRRILSDSVEHTEGDEEDLRDQDERRLAQSSAHAATPANFDDSASMMSETRGSKGLRITRHLRNNDGELYTEVELVRDSRVAREYAKRRAEKDAEHIDIYNLEPAGDPEAEKTKQLRAQVELARLQRNQERRIHRERLKLKKQDGERQNDSPTPATPGPSDLASTTGFDNAKNGDVKEKGKKTKTIPGTTARKCANCGASGHIKTNRKLCPMLNGEWPNGIQPADWGVIRGGGTNNDTTNGTANAVDTKGAETNGVDAASVNGMNSTSAPTSTPNGNGFEENSNGFGNGNGVVHDGMDLNIDMGDDFGADMDLEFGMELGMDMGGDGANDLPAARGGAVDEDEDDDGQLDFDEL